MLSTVLLDVESPVIEKDSSIPRMRHIVDEDRGWPWCLCGHQATTKPKWTFKPVDCVVCESMWWGRGV